MSAPRSITAADEVRISDIVRQIGNIERLEPEQDFFDAGLSSIQALELLAELEASFSVSLPDEEFVKARTVRALGTLIASLPTNGT